MDPVGIRLRISRLRSLLVATLAGSAALAGSSCAKPMHDGDPAAPAPRFEAADAGADLAPERAAPDSGGEMGRLERAIRRYAADRAGRLPVKLDDLTKDLSPEGDRYLTRVPLDPWGRPYAYAVVSARLGAYDLRSYGPDTLPGTADDLVAEAQPVPVH